MNSGRRKYLFLITIMFFALGFLNIIFAWAGFICMILPFILLVTSKKKTWCRNYCPRANLFEVLFRNRSLTGKPGPEWLVRGKEKWLVLVYFLFNLFVLTMSTIMVSVGRIGPVEKI